MNEKQELGSLTARNGFLNEGDVVSKFNNWHNDEDARAWLCLMGYLLNEVESVNAEKVHGYKTDVQVQVTIKLKNLIDAQNIQVKLVSNKSGFNQIDKRWVDKYAELWQMPDEIKSILKRYTGEDKPTIATPKDYRRMYVHEFTDEEQQLILKWLEENKSLIVSDILKGRGQFAAEWMLVIQKVGKISNWILKPMNFCLNHFGNGAIEVTGRGNFKLGKITMQRKGGDGGRPTANMLQFKINPITLFSCE